MAATDNGVKGGGSIRLLPVAVWTVGLIAIIGLLVWWMSVRAGTIGQDELYGHWVELGISSVGLVFALPALLWCLAVAFNLHRPAIALMALLTPFLVGWDLAERSLVDPAVLPFLRPEEMLYVAVSILLILAVLAAAGFSFAAGRRQVAAAHSASRARRLAEEDRKRALREEEESKARAEADRRAERQRRKELIESAVASLAGKIADHGADAAFTKDELALLALLQNSERETALLNEEEAVLRADGMEAELEELRETNRKLRVQLIKLGAANFAGGMLTAGLASAGAASAVGGAYAASSIGRAGRS